VLAIPEEGQECHTLLCGDVREAKYALADIHLLEMACDIVSKSKVLPFLRSSGNTGNADDGEMWKRTLFCRFGI
jgi:hypothetical protein